MDPNIGLSQEYTKETVKFLHTLLADETVLYTKTRNQHWNIESENFISIHEFYESQYHEIEQLIDDIAERIRQLGRLAKGNLQDCLQLTQLKELAYTEDQNKQIKALLNDHETICRQLREKIQNIEEEHNDPGTTDFLTRVLQWHEKTAWMLRSHVRW
ncbi:MAG TPA: DNA starvation/stationary phase protection protein [Chitinophagaceae bacterium]|nr:DNA starvation/stationary phase protection protein [Chitinophagaceae bacterium]